MNDYRTFKINKAISFYLQPGSLVFLDYSDRIIGRQEKPDDISTQKWEKKGEDWGTFKMSDFAKCECLDDGGYCYLDHSPNYPDD